MQFPIAPSDRSSSGFWNGRREETLRLASELRPDVVLMDLAMLRIGRRSTTMQTLVGSARSFLSSLLPPPWWLLALALGTATPVWAQAPGTWAPMADLNQPRAEHTATLLTNGTVLIAGGRGAGGQPLASAEIGDPATAGYRLLASSLPAPVWGHTATRLDDGTVLIAGGQRGARYRRAAQLFDPATETVSAPDPKSP